MRRIRAAGNQSRELPTVNMGHSVEEFFDVLLEDSKGGAKLPNWCVGTLEPIPERLIYRIGAVNSI